MPGTFLGAWDISVNKAKITNNMKLTFCLGMVDWREVDKNNLYNK